MPLILNFLILSLSSAFIPLAAGSLPLPEFTDYGVNTLAIGGMSAATANGPDSILTNPAGLVYFKGKSSSSGSWQTLGTDVSHWNATLIDGTNGVTGGMQFQWLDYGSIRRYTYAVVAAYQTSYGSIGIGGRALDYQHASLGNGWHFTNSIGLLIPLGYGFSIGAVGKSLLDFQVKHEVPPSLSTGLMFSTSKFRGGIEAGRRFKLEGQDWNYSAGGELLAEDYLALRGGYHYDRSHSNSYWTTGLGIIGPRAELSGDFIHSTKGNPKLFGYGFNFATKF